MAGADRSPSSGAPDAGIMARAFAKLDLEGHNLPPSPAPSSPRSGKRYTLATELVYTDSSDQYNASSMPIYQVRELRVWLSEGLLVAEKPETCMHNSPDQFSPPRSSRLRVLAATNTTIRAQVIRRVHIWRGTLPRSWRRSGRWSLVQVWARSM